MDGGCGQGWGRSEAKGVAEIRGKRGKFGVGFRPLDFDLMAFIAMRYKMQNVAHSAQLFFEMRGHLFF